MKNKIIIAGILASSISQVFAGSTTGSIKATAQLNATCTFSVTDINFGAINPNNASYQFANGIMTILCSRQITYNAGISGGLSGDVTNRTMGSTNSNNTDRLRYNISRVQNSTAPSNVWGNDGNVAHQYLVSGGNGIPTPWTMYGYVLPKQYIAPDSYSDTLIATVSF